MPRYLLVVGNNPDHVSCSCPAEGLPWSEISELHARMNQLDIEHGWRNEPRLFYTVVEA